MKDLSISFAAGATILLCVLVTTAAAQVGTEAPSQNPLAPSPIVVQPAGQQPSPAPPASRADGRELTLTGSMFGGYDTNVFEGNTAAPGVRTGAPQMGGNFSVHFGAKSERVAFFSDAAANSTHFRTLQPVTGTSVTGSASVRAAVTRKTLMNLSVSGGYVPQFQFSLLPPDPIAAPVIPTLDYAILGIDAITYRTGIDVTHNLSARSALNGSYSRSSYKYLDRDYELNYQTFGGGYSRGLTRYAALRLGYLEQRADYPLLVRGELRPLRNRTLDVGLDYSRPLSRTRRTTFGFGTGSTGVDNGEEKFYNVAGHASLTHQIGRTWNISTTYARGLGLVGGFVEPFFADSVSLNLRGNTSPRVRLTGSAGYANGDLGLGSRANSFASYQAAADLEVALSQRLAVFGHYFYYNYLFDKNISLPDGLARGLDRHGVRAGLNLRIPILEERNPRVTR